jgi:hypothetical protein
MYISISFQLSIRVCGCVCVRACVRACVWVRVRVRACSCVRERTGPLSHRCPGPRLRGGRRYREYLNTRAADTDPQRPDIAAFVASFVRANR